MEDFKSWPVDRLINLWVDMSTPNFDILLVSSKYGNRKLAIQYLIREKMGLGHKDVMVTLNTKRVGKEEKRNWYYRQNRIYYEKKSKGSQTEQLLAKILQGINNIDKNTSVIRRNNCEISVGTSTQIQLAKELNQKMNGVGLFLAKTTNHIKEHESCRNKSKWEHDCV